MEFFRNLRYTFCINSGAGHAPEPAARGGDANAILHEQASIPRREEVNVENETRRVDIMSEILGSTAPDTPIMNTDDLEKIIYRDPKELQKVVHRAFRLSTMAPALPEDLKKLVEPEKDDFNEEHHSFQLTNLTKKKTTIYFSKKVHLMLKSAKYKIKKMVAPELQSQVSMSSIINNALVIVLHEFELKEDKSILYKQILKKLGR